MSEEATLLRLIWSELKDLGRSLVVRLDETNRRLVDLDRRLVAMRDEARAENAERRREAWLASAAPQGKPKRKAAVKPAARGAARFPRPARRPRPKRGS